MSNTFFRLASVSKKVTMAIAGAFLILFLLVHLGINLLMLRPDGGAWFRAASHFMGNNYLVKIFEVVLGLTLLLHILLGVILWLQNRYARPVKYYRMNRSETSFMAKFMLHTGAIILLFLVIHFMNFYFVKLGLVPPPEGINDTHDFLPMAEKLFSDVYYSVIYIIAFVVLGIHLNHAFQSAFQTFGLHHSKYYTSIKRAALIYAVVVAAGFITIPVFFLFFLN